MKDLDHLGRINISPVELESAIGTLDGVDEVASSRPAMPVRRDPRPPSSPARGPARRRSSHTARPCCRITRSRVMWCFAISRCPDCRAASSTSVAIRWEYHDVPERFPRARNWLADRSINAPTCRRRRQRRSGHIARCPAGEKEHGSVRFHVAYPPVPSTGGEEPCQCLPRTSPPIMSVSTKPAQSHCPGCPSALTTGLRDHESARSIPPCLRCNAACGRMDFTSPACSTHSRCWRRAA